MSSLRSPDPTPREIRVRCREIRRKRVVSREPSHRAAILQLLDVKGAMTGPSIARELGLPETTFYDAARVLVVVGDVEKLLRPHTTYVLADRDEDDFDQPSADSILLRMAS